MGKATIDINELKTIIRQSVQEAVHAELMKMKSDIIPYISDAEQKEIEETYGKPEKDTASSIEVDI